MTDTTPTNPTQQQAPNVDVANQAADVVSTEQQTQATPLEPDFNALVQTRFGLTEQQLSERLSAKPEYSAPFIATLDELVKNGAKSDDIQSFLSIATIDTKAAPAEQVIKAKMRLENPSLGQQHIDALYNQKFAIGEDDPNRLTKEANLIIEGEQAKAYLAEKQKQFALPTDTGKLQEDMQRQASSAAWQPFVDNVVDSVVSKLEIKLKGQQGDSFELDFIPNLTPQEVKEIKDLTMQLAVNQRLTPTKATIEELAGQARSLVEMKRKDEVLLAAVRSAYASGLKAATTARQNGAPVPQGSGAVQQPVQGHQPPKGYV